MQLAKLLLGVPVLALFTYAQTDRSTQSTSGKMQSETRTENTISTRKFKGILVDANCGATTSGASSGSADRSAGESGKDPGSMSRWQSCPVTTSTTEFGLVTSAGRMLRFDAVGNTRAAEAVKSHTKWTTSGKAPKVKVYGVMMGDTLQVQEIR